MTESILNILFFEFFGGSGSTREVREKKMDKTISALFDLIYRKETQMEIEHIIKTLDISSKSLYFDSSKLQI